MNPILCFLAIFLVAPQLGFGNGMRVVYEIESGPTKEKMLFQTKYFIQGTSIRFESESSAGTNVFIAKGNPPDLFMLMPEQKMYVKVPQPNWDEVMKNAEKEGADFKPSGEKREVAGYPCEVYKRKHQGRNEEACVNQTLENVFEKVREAMLRSQRGGSAIPGGLKGFPLEVVIRAEKAKDEAQNMRMRLKELYQGKLEASLFEIPSSYTAQQFPEPDAETLKRIRKLQEEAAQKKK